MAMISLIGYLALQLALCYYLSKKIKSESDYFVADRGFGAPIITLSLFASWFGAETCLGSSGAVYLQGLSGSRADPFGYSLCLLLTGLLIAPKIWNKRYITLSDFYRERYGTSVEQFAVWVLSFSSLIWGAAQLRAFGQVISATTQLDLETTLLISFIFVLTYTMLGGLIGDIITDVIQAFVIGLGLIILLITVLWNTPDVISIVKSIPSDRWALLGQNESWLTRIDRWAVPVLGSLVAQEIVSRIFATRSKQAAIKASYSSAIIYLFMGMIPVFLGLIGPSILQIQGDNEEFLIELASHHLTPFFVGILAGAIIAALLATIDSILLAVGALISHNFLIPKLKLTDERSKLILSRSVVCGAGLIAYILAMHSSGIYELLEMASSFGTAGIFVITILGLWSNLGSKHAAMSALIAGIVTTPIAEYILEWESPFIASISVALSLFICIGCLEKSTLKHPKPGSQ